MTILISILGFIGRAAGRLLTSTLGWASSLLFGRVPRSHQVFVNLLLAGSLLWVATVVIALLPGVTPFLLSTTPHPAFIGAALIRTVILTGLVLLPLGVGMAAYLAPAAGDRPVGLAAVRQILVGYPIAVAMPAILVLLGWVAIARKAGNARRGWSDTHVPIVAKPGGYDRMVSDLQAMLARADLRVTARPAPRVLSMPGQLLARLAGGNIRGLVPERLTQLVGPGLAVDVYPSDIAISGAERERMRARIVIVRGIPWTAAYLTTTAEAQAIEDQLEGLEQQARRPVRLVGSTSASTREQLARVDRALLDARIPTDEWDILDRLRVQVERDLLAAQVPMEPSSPAASAAIATNAPPVAAAR